MNLKIHIVQKGDTLWDIAKKYGVDFEQLKAMNTHLATPDMIMPGMKIKIPGIEKAVPKKTVQKKVEEIKHPYENLVVSEQPVKKEKAQVKKESTKELVKEEEKMPIQESIMPIMPELPEMPMLQLPTVQQVPMMEQTQLPEMKMPKKEELENDKEKIYEQTPVKHQAYPYPIPSLIPCIPLCHMPLNPCLYHEQPMPICHKCMYHEGFQQMNHMSPLVYPGIDPHMYARQEVNEQRVNPYYEAVKIQGEGPPYIETPFYPPQSSMIHNDNQK